MEKIACNKLLYNWYSSLNIVPVMGWAGRAALMVQLRNKNICRETLEKECRN